MSFGKAKKGDFFRKDKLKTVGATAFIHRNPNEESFLHVLKEPKELSAITIGKRVERLLSPDFKIASKSRKKKSTKVVPTPNDPDKVIGRVLELTNRQRARTESSSSLNNPHLVLRGRPTSAVSLQTEPGDFETKQRPGHVPRPRSATARLQQYPAGRPRGLSRLMEAEERGEDPGPTRPPRRSSPPTTPQQPPPPQRWRTAAGDGAAAAAAPFPGGAGVGLKGARRGRHRSDVVPPSTGYGNPPRTPYTNDMQLDYRKPRTTRAMSEGMDRYDQRNRREGGLTFQTNPGPPPLDAWHSPLTKGTQERPRLPHQQHATWSTPQSRRPSQTRTPHEGSWVPPPGGRSGPRLVGGRGGGGGGGAKVVCLEQKEALASRARGLFDRRERRRVFRAWGQVAKLYGTARREAADRARARGLAVRLLRRLSALRQRRQAARRQEARAVQAANQHYFATLGRHLLWPLADRVKRQAWHEGAVAKHMAVQARRQPQRRLRAWHGWAARERQLAQREARCLATWEAGKRRLALALALHHLARLHFQRRRAGAGAAAAAGRVARLRAGRALAWWARAAGARAAAAAARRRLALARAVRAFAARALRRRAARALGRRGAARADAHRARRARRAGLAGWRAGRRRAAAAAAGGAAAAARARGHFLRARGAPLVRRWRAGARAAAARARGRAHWRRRCLRRGLRRAGDRAAARRARRRGGARAAGFFRACRLGPALAHMRGGAHYELTKHQRMKAAKQMAFQNASLKFMDCLASRNSQTSLRKTNLKTAIVYQDTRSMNDVLAALFEWSRGRQDARQEIAKATAMAAKNEGVRALAAFSRLARDGAVARAVLARAQRWRLGREGRPAITACRTRTGLLQVMDKKMKMAKQFHAERISKKGIEMWIEWCGVKSKLRGRSQVAQGTLAKRAGADGMGEWKRWVTQRAVLRQRAAAADKLQRAGGTTGSRWRREGMAAWTAFCLCRSVLRQRACIAGEAQARIGGAAGVAAWARWVGVRAVLRRRAAAGEGARGRHAGRGAAAAWARRARDRAALRARFGRGAEAWGRGRRREAVGEWRHWRKNRKLLKERSEAARRQPTRWALLGLWRPRAARRRALRRRSAAADAHQQRRGRRAAVARWEACVADRARLAERGRRAEAHHQGQRRGDAVGEWARWAGHRRALRGRARAADGRRRAGAVGRWAGWCSNRRRLRSITMLADNNHREMMMKHLHFQPERLDHVEGGHSVPQEEEETKEEEGRKTHDGGASRSNGQKVLVQREIAQWLQYQGNRCVLRGRRNAADHFHKHFSEKSAVGRWAGRRAARAALRRRAAAARARHGAHGARRAVRSWAAVHARRAVRRGRASPRRGAAYPRRGSAAVYLFGFLSVWNLSLGPRFLSAFKTQEETAGLHYRRYLLLLIWRHWIHFYHHLSSTYGTAAPHHHWRSLRLGLATWHHNVQQRRHLAWVLRRRYVRASNEVWRYWRVMARRATQRRHLQAQTLSELKFKMITRKANYKMWAELSWEVRKHCSARVIQKNWRRHRKALERWAMAVIQYHVFLHFKPLLRRLRQGREELRARMETASYAKVLERAGALVDRYLRTEGGARNLALYEKEFAERRSKGTTKKGPFGRKPKSLDALKATYTWEFEMLARANFRQARPPRFACPRCEAVFCFEREMLAHALRAERQGGTGCVGDRPEQGPVEAALVQNMLKVTFQSLKLDLGASTKRQMILTKEGTFR